jgi:hypothetical protein
MLTRIYGLVWFFLAATVVGLHLGGYLNEQVLTMVGFLTATLVFIGMSILLPVSVAQRSASGY